MSNTLKYVVRDQKSKPTEQKEKQSRTLTHTHNTHAHAHKENSHTHTMWLLFMKCGFEMDCMRTYSTFKTNLAGVKTQLLFITVDHTLPPVVCDIARNSNCIAVTFYGCYGDHIMDNTQVQLSLQTPPTQHSGYQVLQ